MPAFIQFMRCEAAEALLKHPNAFTLLALIAQRARRDVPQINPFGLQVGEAMVGDHAAVGLTRQEFRTALNNLQKWSLITTRTTNKGTIAKLSGTSIYDINAEALNQPVNQTTTTNQPDNNQTTTTNKNVKNDNKKEVKDGAPAPSPAQDLATPLKAKPAAEPRRPPGACWPDEAKVFTISGFREFLKSIGFGGVDTGYYLPLVQRAAEKTGEERPNDGKGKTWEDFVQWYFSLERRYDRLVFPMPPADAGPNKSFQIGQSTTTTSTSYNPATIAAQNKTPVY